MIHIGNKAAALKMVNGTDSIINQVQMTTVPTTQKVCKTPLLLNSGVDGMDSRAFVAG